MENLSTLFGSLVFNDEVMKTRLPKDTYKAFRKTITNNVPLDSSVANVVASAMKDWATEKGATHFTHWFQPMTGVTAEKHDSFISPNGDGRVIAEFSGKELIKGEPDASSFPSGGLRSTFEARGYTAWDPTSYAFIKDGILCIPTAFCSYSGEALDKKTPLLRSMEAVNKQSLRILKLFGTTATSVKTTVGPEQEYFLIPEELFDKREDLIYTGRTLFGAKAPKGQELEDHYFGQIKPKVQEFMKELNEELWKLGVLAKTEHNEVAPAQHELAPIFTTTNIACDHNQLTMEVMRKVAKKHGMVCLLHEKPFDGVNGSGKHNNWSISTDTGINLLEPGDTPFDNAQFLIFLSAVIKAVDEYQDLLRISASSAGNDHRLGANEAPPAVVSIFLGGELTEVLEAIAKDDPSFNGKKKTRMLVGVDAIPYIIKDTTDRNRTSPFAFTGNKFEFRMLGSNASIAETNTVLNTAVAEVLKGFADKLEKAPDFTAALHDIVKDTYVEHKRIIFNGNGYDKAWLEEAARRGLSNYPTTPDCLPRMLDEKNIELFTENGVYTEKEVRARCEIMLENYVKTVNIEARTMIEMAKKDILPAMSSYTTDLASSIEEKSEVCESVNLDYEKETLVDLSEYLGKAYHSMKELEKLVTGAPEEAYEAAKYFAAKVIPAMTELRKWVDKAEVVVPTAYWPYPTYGELLFGVR